MKRLIPWAGLALGLFVPLGPAGASGDYGCEPSWKLASKAFSTCDNRAALAPGNDTRVNLFLLQQARPAAPAGTLSYPENWEVRTLGRGFFYWSLLRTAYDPGYAQFEEGRGEGGSRCDSLNGGTDDFGAAMKANAKLPGAERETLAQARSQLSARCSGSAGSGWPAGIRSAPGREYLAYLQAADAFYGESWDAARQGFTGLRASRDPWVAEVSAYMLARTELNAAQASSFDQYGYFAGPEKADRAALARARTAFDDYLKHYGQGRYAASAQGLIRRALWLAGDAAGLAREYERLLAALQPTSRGSADLVQEIDNKLLMMSGAGRAAVDTPLLLATIDLMLMRDAEDSGVPVIGAMELAAQEARFAGRADLFSFVTASHAFYVRKDMRRVLQLIPDDARQPAYAPLAFSRQVLRGMALAALKDRNEGGFWRELLGGATALYQRPLVELVLAMNYERSGRLGEVFAAGSPINETVLREILLQNVAGPELLRTQVRNTSRPQHERDLALFTLLHKRLTHGDYAGFLADSALVRGAAPTGEGLWDLQQQEKIPVGLYRSGTWGDGYSCPVLAATVGTLARDPGNARARLCLGEFYRLNGFDDLYRYDSAPAADELGGSASQFPGKPLFRDGLYSAVITDPRAAAPEKAYALYRAVQCYAPGGNNSCGGSEVPKSQRKAWFDRLKREFPSIEWARKARYFW